MSWMIFAAIGAVFVLGWSVLHRAQVDDKTRKKPRRIIGGD